MYRTENCVAFLLMSVEKLAKFVCPTLHFCIPRSSKFQKYEQRGKGLNLFCFLNSDVLTCYSGVSLLKKVG